MRALRFAVWASAVGVAMIHGAAFASVREERVAPLPTAPVHGQSTSIGRSGVSSCDRWRALAARLGETHAGHKLRHLLTTRLCVLTEDTSDEVWAWPWRFSDVRADLPPQHHGKFGAWDIRCDQAGQRRRCALSLETSMVLGGDPSRPIRIARARCAGSVAEMR